MKTKVRYINRKDSNYLETVDEFPFNNKEERVEARRCLTEYQFSDRYASYNLSQRCTKDWKTK